VADPNQVTAVVSLPNAGVRYYFSVTAVAGANESSLSNETSKLSLATVVDPILGTPVCPACLFSFTGLVLSGVTGNTFVVVWNVMTVPSRVEMYEYPPKVGATPVASGNFPAGVSSFNWVPKKAGLYYSRVCGTSCVNSYNNGFLFYVKLASPGGGGIG
jgi:hypothetical protein